MIPIKFLFDNVFKQDLLEKGLPFSNKSFILGSHWDLDHKLCLEVKELKTETDSLVIYFFIMLELLFGQRPILGKINKKEKVNLSLVCSLTKDNFFNFIYILKVFRPKGLKMVVVNQSKTKVIFSIKNFFVLRPLPGKLWGRVKGFELFLTLNFAASITSEEKELIRSIFQLY